MKRRTRLLSILGIVLVVVLVLVAMHLNVRGQITNYLLQRYPSENFTIDYISYGVFPRTATASVQTRSDEMEFEVVGDFRAFSLQMDLTDNYYVSRSDLYYRERLDPVIRNYGARIFDYELHIRADMAPVQAGTRPIYPFELHVVLGPDIIDPEDYVIHVSAIASEITRQNIEGMEILHFVSVPVRPDQETLRPHGLDIGFIRAVQEPPAEDGTAEEPVRVSEFVLRGEHMYEIYLDPGDRPFTEGLIRNGFRLVPVERQQFAALGIRSLPTVPGTAAEAEESGRLPEATEEFQDDDMAD